METAINTSLVIPLNLWHPRCQGPRRGRGWVKNILFYFTEPHPSLTKTTYLTCYKEYIKAFFDKLNNFRQFIVSLAAEQMTRFQPEMMGFQLLFLFSFVPGSVFQEDKVSSLSLSKFERVFAQWHSFQWKLSLSPLRITEHLKLRIMYSYGHPGPFNPTDITNKKDNLRKHEQQNWVFKSCWLSHKNKSKISASSACCVGQMEGQD